MKRLFIIDADEFDQTDFELIHRYVRRRLEQKNRGKIVIRSFVMDRKEEHHIQCIGHLCDIDTFPLNIGIETLINSTDYRV